MGASQDGPFHLAQQRIPPTASMRLAKLGDSTCGYLACALNPMRTAVGEDEHALIAVRISRVRVLFVEHTGRITVQRLAIDRVTPLVPIHQVERGRTLTWSGRGYPPP